MKQSKFWLFIILLTGTLISCGGEPTPIAVYITATPNETPKDIVAPRVRSFPGPSPTPNVSPTPTATATIKPTKPPEQATHTPAAPSFPNVPPAEQLPVLTQSRMGIQLHPFLERDEWDQMLFAVDQLKFDWIKIQVPWEELEPAPGQYSEWFQTYVQRVQWASFVGGRKRLVLISIAKAPNWSRPQNADPTLDGPPANPDDLTRFLTNFIQATGVADHRIAAVEVWNEPNLEREWNGVGFDGGTYMTYFRAAYDAIKAIDPTITVVTAGLAPVGDGVPGSVGDRTFLRQMYTAGLASYADARIGVHPYGWANPPDTRCCTEERPWANNPVFYFQDTLFDYHDIMQENAHNTKIWITEFGWGTYKGVGIGGADVSPVPQHAEFFDLITPQQQAEYIMRAFELLHQSPLSDFVEREFLWNLNFAAIPYAVDQRLEQAGYSLLDASGYPRLAYYYLFVSRRQP